MLHTMTAGLMLIVNANVALLTRKGDRVFHLARMLVDDSLGGPRCACSLNSPIQAHHQAPSLDARIRLASRPCVAARRLTLFVHAEMYSGSQYGTSHGTADA